MKIRINHPGEVNRSPSPLLPSPDSLSARLCPQNPSLIATKSPGAEVLVFDYRRHPSVPSDNKVKPDMTLKGHTKDGSVFPSRFLSPHSYGLSWSPLADGELLSASNDKTICQWQLSDQTGEARAVYTAHTEAVEDVAWHLDHASYFGSVGDDQKLIMSAHSLLTSPGSILSAGMCVRRPTSPQTLSLPTWLR